MDARPAAPTPATMASSKQLPPRPPQASLSKPLPPSPPRSPRDTGEAAERNLNVGLKEELGYLNTGSGRASPSPASASTTSPSALRPIMERRLTAPEADLPSSPTARIAALSIQPRNRSPYARAAIRTPTSGSSTPVSSPRSKSLPYNDAMRPSSPLLRPASPFSTAGRRVSPLRRPYEDSFSFAGVEIDQTIAEHSELDLKPRPVVSIDSIDGSSTPTTPISPYAAHGTFPRTRRRPSSPLHLMGPGHSRLHASASSPALRGSPAHSPVDPAKFNEVYPGPIGGGSVIERSSIGSHSSLHHPSTSTSSSYYGNSTSASIFSASGSSMPSTPSSFRSRSPSISSLETIPDSPDAEAAAVAAIEHDQDALARLRAAAEKHRDADGSRTRGRTMGRLSDGTGLNGVGGSDKRKRWSVCGAERRGDLEMETIWED